MTAACPPPRQTGRADFPHPAFAWRYGVKHSQLDQSETVIEILIKGDLLRPPPPPLTTSSQMSGHSQSHVRVDTPKGLRRVAFGEVVGPALQVGVEFFDEFGQRFSALVITGHFPQLLALSRKGLLARLHVPILLVATVEIVLIAKAIAKELQPLCLRPKVNDAGFLSVDFQPKPAFDLFFYKLLKVFADVARHYHKVVAISHQLSLSPVSWTIGPTKDMVEPVQVDVRQKRRDHPALRRAFVVAFDPRFPSLFSLDHRRL
jgi:hypothetical protein